MRYEIQQERRGRYVFVALKDGARAGTLAEIVDGRGKGVDATYEMSATYGCVSGTGTHQACREQVCQLVGIDPMHVDGHTFTRKQDKRRVMAA